MSKLKIQHNEDSSDDEWVDIDPKLNIPTNGNSKRKRSSESDSEDDEQLDLLAQQLLGDSLSNAIKTDKKARRSTVDSFKDLELITPENRAKMETILRSKLPQTIQFANFNLAENGAVIWRDEPAQGNDTILNIPSENIQAEKWYVISIWFGGEKTSDALILAPVLKKGKQSNENVARLLSHPLPQNQLWISGKTLIEKQYKIVFHKKKWPLGRHYTSNTLSRTVPLFVITMAPFVEDSIDMDSALRSDTFVICSKRQPAQLQHARGGSSSSRSTGNIRRNKHIARLENENRAHAAQVVKVNVDNRRLIIRDEQHTKGFEHLLKMAQHLKPSLTSTDKLTMEVLSFVSSHLAKTARSKRAMC